VREILKRDVSNYNSYVKLMTWASLRQVRGFLPAVCARQPPFVCLSVVLSGWTTWVGDALAWARCDRSAVCVCWRSGCVTMRVLSYIMYLLVLAEQRSLLICRLVTARCSSSSIGGPLWMPKSDTSVLLWYSVTTFRIPPTSKQLDCIILQF